MIPRQDIIERSESMEPDERQQFAKKIMTPLESIAKHLTVQSALDESKIEEDGNLEATSLPLRRYHEISLDDRDENDRRSLVLDNDSEVYPNSNNEEGSVERAAIVPPNHKLSIDEDYASTEKYETDVQKIMLTTERDCVNCDSTTVIGSPKANVNNSVDLSQDMDTIEEYQRYHHGSQL